MQLHLQSDLGLVIDLRLEIVGSEIMLQRTSDMLTLDFFLGYDSQVSLQMWLTLVDQEL